jgi:hypothetical protein
MIGMGDPDSGNGSPRVAAGLGNNVTAVSGAAFAVVEAYDIRELDDGGRILHAGGVDELDAVRGSHISLEPDEKSR